MPCPVPSSPPTSPALSTVLEDVAAVDPREASRLRPRVVELEKSQAHAREQLAAAESALSLVRPTGLRVAYEEWCTRSTAVWQARREVRMLGVDADVLREQLERAIFLARQSAAIGKRLCPACGGTGEGESLDGGTALVPTSCDTCQGSGFAPPAQPCPDGGAA